MTPQSIRLLILFLNLEQTGEIPMPKQYNEDDDFDERGVLKEGRTLHVGMQFMDSMSRAIATDSTMRKVRDAITHDTSATVVDAFGDSGLALNKPGSRYLTAGHRSIDHAVQTTREYERWQAYADCVQATCDAWRGNNRDLHEVPRIHNTGDATRDAYLDSVSDLVNSWHRGSGKR
jgi:hypothetical protein